MAKKDRLEQIRKVRSLNDVLEILEDIRKDSTEDEKIARRLNVSLSADEEIEITHGQPSKTRRINTKSKKTNVSFSDKVAVFKAPPKAAITKHVTVLQRLYDNAKELDAIEAMLKQSFSGVKAQSDAVRSVTALRKNVDASIRVALEGLNRVAMKHIPTELNKMRDRLTTFLLDSISEKLYSDIGFLEYVSLGDRDEIVFSVYVEIKNLKNSHGYVFDEYFIILTGVVDAKGNIAYFINALPDFRVPGKYALGSQVVSNASMEQRVSMLLAHNDVVTGLERMPLPVDGENTKNFSAIRGVVGVKVKDDSLYLQVGKLTAKAEEAIVKDTMALLNMAMRRKKNANISWKPVSVGGKRYLKFILYFKQGSAPKTLNAAKLGDIKDALDLDDKTMSALRKSMLD